MTRELRDGVNARDLPLWMRVVLLAVGYALAAEVGNALSVQHVFSTFWPAAGVFVAFLLLSEYREWPALIAAVVLANTASDLIHGRELLMTLGYSTANSVEAVIGAALVRRFAGPRPTMVTLREVVSLAVFGAILAPAVGAAIGTAVVSVTSGTSDPFRTWSTWWIGDLVGVIAVAPLALTGEAYVRRFTSLSRTGRRRALLEVLWALLIAVPLGLAGRLIMSLTKSGPEWRFLLLPGMLFAGVWLGPVGAAVTTATVVLASVWTLAQTANGAASVDAALALRVFETQASIAVAGITTLALAAAAEDGRRAADAARVSAEKYQVLFDRFPVGVTITDEEGTVIETSARAAEILGVDHDEQVRRGIGGPEWRVVRPDGSRMPDDELPAVRALSEGVAVENVEMGIVGPDRTSWINVTAAPIPASGYGIAAVYEDITDKMEAEAGLRRSEARFRELVSSVGDVVVCTDPDGLVEEFNPGAERFLGARRDEALGKDFVATFIDRADRARFTDAMRRALTGEPVRGVETRTGHGADARDMLWSMRMYETRDGGPGVIAAGQDITGRTKAERELRTLKESLEEKVASRTQDLERTNRELVEASKSKSRFLGNMSHELRTPLNSVIGFSGVLLSEAPGPVNDEQRKQLTMIKGAGEHLLSIVNDILDLTRIEAGKETLRISQFAVEDVVARVVETILPAAEAKALEFRVTPSLESIRMTTDAGKLVQILSNLLDNAVKFTESGSVLLEYEAVRDTVVFRVTDTGIGIPTTEVSRIMEDFQQVDRAGDGMKPEGTGLGLSICRNLAMLLGGDVTAESALGKGSTFSLVVPVHRWVAS